MGEREEGEGSKEGQEGRVELDVDDAGDGNTTTSEKISLSISSVAVTDAPFPLL
jgi:hypothetical protein